MEGQGRRRQEREVARPASAPRATRASPARSRPRPARIGYVELAYAKQNKLAVRVDARTQAGKFVDAVARRHHRPRRPARVDDARRPPRLDRRTRAGDARLSDLGVHLHPRLRGADGRGRRARRSPSSSGGRSTTARSSAPPLDYAPLPGRGRDQGRGQAARRCSAGGQAAPAGQLSRASASSATPVDAAGRASPRQRRSCRALGARGQPGRPRRSARSTAASPRWCIVALGRDGAAADARVVAQHRAVRLRLRHSAATGIRCATRSARCRSSTARSSRRCSRCCIAVPVSLGVAHLPHRAGARAGCAARSASWSSCSRRSRASSTACGASSCSRRWLREHGRAAARAARSASCRSSRARRSASACSPAGIDPRDHDPADDRVGHARGAARRADRRSARARSALGATRWETIRVGGAAVRALRHRRRDHPRPRPRARRDDGGDDGDRQPRRDLAPRSSRRGYTMASVIANEFTEAAGDLYLLGARPSSACSCSSVTRAAQHRRARCWSGASSRLPAGARRADDATRYRRRKLVDVARARRLRRRAAARRSSRSSACSATCCARGIGGLSWDFFTELPQAGRRGRRRHRQRDRRHAGAGRAGLRDRHPARHAAPASTSPSSATAASAKRGALLRRRAVAACPRSSSASSSTRWSCCRCGASRRSPAASRSRS